jgi:hypothetical protein
LENKLNFFRQKQDETITIFETFLSLEIVERQTAKDIITNGNILQGHIKSIETMS